MLILDQAYIDFTKSKDLVADVKAATPEGLGAHAVLLLAASEKPFQQAVEYARPRGASSPSVYPRMCSSKHRSSRLLLR